MSSTCTWQSQVASSSVRAGLESDNYLFKLPITERNHYGLEVTWERVPQAGEKEMSKVPEERQSVVYSGHGEWPSLAQREDSSCPSIELETLVKDWAEV